MNYRVRNTAHAISGFPHFGEVLGVPITGAYQDTASNVKYKLLKLVPHTMIKGK